MRRCHHGDGKAIGEDDYYEDVIKKLYKPAVKTPTMGAVITQSELPFEVDPAPEPEPAVTAEPEPAVTAEPEPETGGKNTTLDRLKTWLNAFMKDVAE